MGPRWKKCCVAAVLIVFFLFVLEAMAAWAVHRSHAPSGWNLTEPPRATAGRSKKPVLFLWAWERPEDLRFLDSRQNVGVAFLAETIEIGPQSSSKDGTGVVLLPRRQPLRVHEGTPLMAVVRIETPHDLWHQRAGAQASAGTSADLYTAAQRQRVVELLASAAKLPRVSALQVDFDASESEQGFYAALLQDVRQRLLQEMPLSITALASWCIGDPWLDKLPAGTIDEAVPMLFRMGPDAGNVASYIESGKKFEPQVCRGSLGLSTDEQFSQGLLDGTIEAGSSGKESKRIYVFSDHAWTEEEAQNVSKEAEQ